MTFIRMIKKLKESNFLPISLVFQQNPENIKDNLLLPPTGNCMQACLAK